MSKMWTRATLLVCALLLPALATSARQDQDLAPLKTEIQKIIAEYHGEVGVAIEHVETGRGFAINGHKRFPLASVYKVPIMVEVFRQAAEGKFSLRDRITVGPESYHPWGRVIPRFEPGLNPTVRDLVYWMMVESDNVATDILLKKAGAENVNATLRKLGLDEIRVDRLTRVMILDYYGFSGDKYYKLTGEELKPIYRQSLAIVRDRLEVARAHGPLPEAVVKYDQDPRDTGSPLHINALMVKIFKGEVVSKKACQEMIEIMLDCRTGETKIKGLLPPGTPVAHKTGGWPTSNNDAGIIFLPNNKGHLAVTVLDTDMNEDLPVSAKMIARIARAAYDFFVGKR